jgi:hypothetical protein
MYLGLHLEVDLQSFSNFSARKKCVVSVTYRPLYPEKEPPLPTGWGRGWVGPKHAASAEKRKMYWSPSGNQTPIPWLPNPLPIHYTDSVTQLTSRHDTLNSPQTYTCSTGVTVFHRRLYNTDLSFRPWAKTNYEAQTLNPGVQNVWCYSTTPPYVPMTWCLIKHTAQLYHLICRYLNEQLTHNVRTESSFDEKLCTTVRTLQSLLAKTLQNIALQTVLFIAVLLAVERTTWLLHSDRWCRPLCSAQPGDTNTFSTNTQFVPHSKHLHVHDNLVRGNNRSLL